MNGKRLGRGEALRRLLDSQSSSPQPQGRSPPSLEAEERYEPATPPPRPAGRSALFADFSKPKEDVQPKPEAPKPGGRGRALLASLAASSAPSRDIKEDIENITRRTAQLSSREAPDEPKNPVIMKGSTGREISLSANYVRLRIEEGKGLFQYDVRYEPEVDSKNLRFTLINQFRDVIGETRLFDGAILYLPKLLPDKVTRLNSRLPSDDSPVVISITFTAERRYGHKDAIHLYNVLLRRIMVVLGLALHGEHFYDPKSAMPIPLHKLEVWPGYVTAIDEFEGGLMLCCNSSHRVLRNQTVLDLMNEHELSNRRTWKDDFVNLILGQSVLTRYNNKVYRIDDVSFDESPRDTFEKSNGERMTYIQYYRQQYNLSIDEPSQPLLKSKVKTRIQGKEQRQLVSLVPELCYLTGITDTMRADMKVMKDLTQCICVPPRPRVLALQNFVRNVKSSEEARKILSDWGLFLEDAQVHLPGRLLPPIDISFKNFTARGNPEASWTGPSNKNHVLTAVEINNWAVVCRKQDEQITFQFTDQMKKISPQVGMRMVPPRVCTIPDDRTDNYIRNLRAILGDSRVQIVMIVFPMARNDKYSAVKKLCCIDQPVASQAMLARTVRKGTTARAIALKVAMQMNCKLGGTLWSVPIPVQSTMVCGFDSYHDPKRASNSVGALVCSLNQQLTRWYSKIFRQPPGIEFANAFEATMSACLQKYREINGSYPEQVILYRDGVSDGQIRFCKEFEIPQILQSFKLISPHYDPKFLVVVVQKRINTRIYEHSPRDNNYSNPPAGTVLDHTITRRYLYDFFLVSQHVTQGTVSPTHFIVVYNSTNMTPDQIQRFSYTLTHLYYNWPGTIRVPAPCQYAHKLAYLVGESIHKEASESLADKLFYL